MRKDTIITIYAGAAFIREQACYDDSRLTPDDVWSFILDTNLPFVYPSDHPSKLTKADCTYTLRQVDNAKRVRMTPFDYTIPIGDTDIPIKACPSCQCNLLRQPPDTQYSQCSYCSQLLKDA